MCARIKTRPPRVTQTHQNGLENRQVAAAPRPDCVCVTEPAVGGGDGGRGRADKRKPCGASTVCGVRASRESLQQRTSAARRVESKLYDGQRFITDDVALHVAHSLQRALRDVESRRMQCGGASGRFVCLRRATGPVLRCGGESSEVASNGGLRRPVASGAAAPAAAAAALEATPAEGVVDVEERLGTVQAGCLPREVRLVVLCAAPERGGLQCKGGVVPQHCLPAAVVALPQAWVVIAVPHAGRQIARRAPARWAPSIKLSSRVSLSAVLRIMGVRVASTIRGDIPEERAERKGCGPRPADPGTVPSDSSTTGSAHAKPSTRSRVRRQLCLSWHKGHAVNHLYRNLR